MTDPISDMIISIKNASMASMKQMELAHSKMREAIAKILVENKYLEAYEVVKQEPQSKLVLKLRYVGRTPAISGVKLLSTPGRRLYSSVKKIPRTLGGYGVTLITTNQGIITDKQAKKLNVSGELICQIW